MARQDKGDGPAASGLEPKPAIHANIPFDKLPIDYLYNVINHGGAAMGKSPNMPYWGLTIGQQGVADVMAYLKVTFKGVPDIAQGRRVRWRADRRMPAAQQNGECAGGIPDEDESSSCSDATIQAGKTLFLQTAQPVACAMCHGEQGQRARLHGRGVDAAAAKLYLWHDDERHSGWSAVLDHQERFAWNRHDVLCRITG